MTRLVAITGLRSPSVDGLRFAGHAVSEAIVEAVVRAGGTPVVLPPVEATMNLDLSLFDAVLIPGGRDLDARLYRSGAPSTTECDRVHDDVELWVARQCVGLGLPLLAVCRGLQVLNVALGGTLIEDLPASGVAHRNGFHEVSLDMESLTARVMGSRSVTVSSYHHQAVGQLGEGLVVVGTAQDGCIEAVEHRAAPVIAVQWHPEDNASQATEQQALFDAFINLNVSPSASAV